MNAITMTDDVGTYAGLVQQIRKDLRVQHPEWIQPNGQCPMCDSYETRLIKLLDVSIRENPTEIGQRRFLGVCRLAA